MSPFKKAARFGCFVLVIAAYRAEASEAKAFFLFDPALSDRVNCQNGVKSCPATSRTVAAGIVADGAADVLVAVQSQTQPTSATIAITNEGTLVPYDPNIHTYPPKAGSATLTVSGSQIVEYEPGVYILANAQAPDILKPGADGGYTDYSQPIIATVSGPDIPTQTTQLQVYPPPVLFLHGLWGNKTSLASVAKFLSGMAPWQGLPTSFLTLFQYQNDAAFDSTVISKAVSDQVDMIASALENDQIAVGRIDVVAHSMGGLVARHYTSLSDYEVTSSRTLGLFHQIITLDTPENGSGLATFLVNNQNAALSSAAAMGPKAFTEVACPDATTLSSCLVAVGDNLAPPNAPITQGAVYSLEPTSPNLSGAPSANIPNTIWNAVSATVNQKNTMSPGANGLVFELDELVAATCPGASYCPEASSTIPTVTTVLDTPDNDAVVTAASQTAGCSSGCVSQAFKNLAHTAPAKASELKMFGVSDANVLASSNVDAFVACKLANTACSAAEPEAAFASSQRADGRQDLRSNTPDESLPLPRRVTPLLIAPESGVMGEDVSFNLKIPFERVVAVNVNQIKGGRGYDDSTAKISLAPDGTTRVTVTPLLIGRVELDIVTQLTNHEFAANPISMNFAPPVRAPLHFFADQTCETAGPKACVSHMHVGTEHNLWPVLILRAAPDKELSVGQFSSYTAVQDAADPVIALEPDGSYKALRDGNATIVVSYAGYQTSLEVDVTRRFPLMIGPAQ